jgi:tRNA wybutosine-synthesizing protein 2
VRERIQVVLGDNRTVALPTGAADRVFLGYLPTAVPWVEGAVRLLRPTGGWLHVHMVVDARGALAEAERTVTRAVQATGGELDGPPRGREVKPYGPGRTHVVVDARAVPARA